MGGKTFLAVLGALVVGLAGPVAATETTDLDGITPPERVQPLPAAATDDCWIEITSSTTLVADTDCSLSMDVDGITLDLGGHTVRGEIHNSGWGTTIRNGTVTDQVWLYGGRNVIDGVTFRGIDDWALTVGCDDRVRGSRFVDNAFGIDHYYCSQLDVRTTTFLRNGIGVSVVSAGSVLLNGNTFEDNGTAVNIQDDLGSNSPDVVVKRNRFEGNDTGVFLGSYGVGSDTWILRNDFIRNGSSGVVLDLTCWEGVDCATGTRIEDNRFIGNGREPVERWSEHDGTYSTFLPDDGLTVVGFDEYVERVKVSRNVTVNNADLGIDAPGVTDGRGNRARNNGDPAQCIGVVCRP